MKSIDELRIRVSALDSALASLVAVRAAYVSEIREAKLSLNMPTIDLSREDEVRENIYNSLKKAGMDNEDFASQLATVLLRRGV